MRLDGDQCQQRQVLVLRVSGADPAEQQQSRGCQDRPQVPLQAVENPPTPLLQ